MKNKEWNSQWNPFNSYKALVWREHFEGIVKGEFLPPVTVDTDPTNVCNYNCIWCNSHGFRKRSPGMLSGKHLENLADFYHSWGVKSTCVAGGGEPLLNNNTLYFLNDLHRLGIEAGLITNGYYLDNYSSMIIRETCRWVGISMDAATDETYDKIKRPSDKNSFKTVIRNVEMLCSLSENESVNCDTCFKFLIHPLNYKEILSAVKLAKNLGFKDFHARPVGWDNLEVTKNTERLVYTEDMLKEINDQMDAAMELESHNFHVYGIRHKFNADLSRKVKFEKCRALPLLPTFGADGNVHLCFDMRGNPDMVLCKHDPDPTEILKHWGTDRHKELMDSIDPNNCPRCTFSVYNEIVENVFMKDGMCINFP